MAIVGFNIDKMEVEKTKDINAQVKIENNVGITNLAEEKIDMGDGKRELLKISFSFLTKYSPDMGKIEFKGHLLYADAPLKIKEIIKTWTKSKKIDPKLMTLFINAVLMRCNIKALIYSQDVNLPPPIRLPMVTPNPKAESYIG